MTGKEENGSYIIESTRVGAQVKVTACDPETGLEATVMGPASASQRDMATLAVRKLQYLMQKHGGTQE